MNLITRYHDYDTKEYLCFRHAVLRAVTFRHRIRVEIEVDSREWLDCSECAREREAIDKEVKQAYQEGQDDAHSQFNKRQTRIQDSGLTPVVEGVQPVADLFAVLEKGVHDA